MSHTAMAKIYIYVRFGVRKRYLHVNISRNSNMKSVKILTHQLRGERNKVIFDGETSSRGLQLFWSKLQVFNELLLKLAHTIET